MIGTRQVGVALILGLAVTVGCKGDSSGDGGGTDGSGDDGSGDGGPGDDGSGDDGSGDDGSGDDGSGDDGSSDGGGPPPGTPGTYASSTTEPPGGEPTACEWEWTIRTIHYHPGALVPRRMYFSACDTDTDTPKMLTSLTVGENAQHPEEDPSSGGIIVSVLDPDTATMEATDKRHFPECISMHGIATSSDCSTIAALCRIPSGTPGFDKDVLATHPDADWMTQPYVCGDRGLNDEMWLYEWTDGDIQSEPTRYIVHKAIGSWEYGNNYLRLAENDNTYGIAIKTTVGGADGPDTCHEADAFLVMDRSDNTMTTRGWSWACGTGHTTFNRVAYNPATSKYALMCSTDYNEAETGGLGAYVFRMEDGDAQEFHYMNLDGIKNKGGASAILATPDGGYLGVLVGVDGEVSPEGYPLEPPTSIGLAKWDQNGVMQGEIDWVVQESDAYVSYSTLAEIEPGRYLLGWGTMFRLADQDDGGEVSMRIPWDYYVMEIDESGEPITDPILLEGAGWGELDEPVPLGNGRVAWTYIQNPALTGDYEHPSCNQPEVQMTVYSVAG
jgi:hypothetical protein